MWPAERGGPGAPPACSSLAACGDCWRPDLPTFQRELGLGPAKYAQLQAVLEMGRRHLAETIIRDPALESPRAVRRYLKVDAAS